MEAGRTLDAIRQALMEPETLAALRAADIDQEKLSKLRQMIDVTPDVNISGEMPDEEIRKAIDAVDDQDRKKALTLLSALSQEIDMPRRMLHGVVFDPKGKEKVLRVSILRQPLRTRDAGLLLLDGTGDPGLNRTLFGANLRHEEARFERDAEVIGTIGKRYSRQSITGCDADGNPIKSRKDDAKKLRQDIGVIMDRNPEFLLVAAKAAEEALKAGKHLPSGTETTHFGNLRGKNDWETLPGVLSVGRQSLSIEDLEMTARAYLARDPRPFTSMVGPMPDDWPCRQWPYKATRMRRMRDGTLQPVDVDVHPDPRVQAVLEQMREAEAIQGIDRPRPVYNHRTIIAMNELVLDLTYDKILTHRQLVQGGGRIERIIEMTGVVPESERVLAEVYDKIFTSPAMAGRDFREWREKLLQNPKSNTLWKMKQFFCRREGQRGPDLKVWISDKYQDPRAAAEAVLGKLTMFEPVVAAGPPLDVPDVAVPMPDAVPDAAPDVPESAPEPTPEPVAMAVSPPPILATLRITQADSIILPSPPPVVATARLLQQEQRMILPIAPPPAAEPLPPLPEPDFGSLEFWDEHEFSAAFFDKRQEQHG